MHNSAFEIVSNGVWEKEYSGDHPASSASGWVQPDGTFWRPILSSDSDQPVATIILGLLYAHSREPPILGATTGAVGGLVDSFIEYGWRAERCLSSDCELVASCHARQIVVRTRISFVRISTLLPVGNHSLLLGRKFGCSYWTLMF